MMNQEYQHSEIIDAYLRNDLSAGQKVDFEELLRQDPLLYNEFALQQDIVSNLQNHRKSQLKARLNQVDVSSPAQLGSVGTAAIWLAGASLVCLLGWFAYTGVDNGRADTFSVSVVQSAAPDPTVAMPPTTQDENPHAVGNTAETAKTPKTAIRKSGNSMRRKAKTTNASQSIVARKSSLPLSVRSESLDSGWIQASLPVTSSGKADAGTPPAKPSVAVYEKTGGVHNRLNVIDNTDNRLKLHYYYQNGRIALLGFEKSYAFLEVPAENTTYLFYEDNFYKLKLNQFRPAPIKDVLVTDATVVESLRKLLEERK